MKWWSPTRPSGGSCENPRDNSRAKWLYQRLASLSAVLKRGLEPAMSLGADGIVTAALVNEPLTGQR